MYCVLVKCTISYRINEPIWSTGTQNANLVFYFGIDEEDDNSKTVESTPDTEISELKNTSGDEDGQRQTSDPMDIPTAVEVSLPWKRQTGREARSSSYVHSLPDDADPSLGEAPSWVGNLDYTHSIPRIPSPMLPRSATILGVFSHEFRTKDDGSDDTLPPPWRESSVTSEPQTAREISIAIGNEKEKQDGEETDTELPLPWKCLDTPDSDVIPSMTGDKLGDSLKAGEDAVDRYSTECSLGESIHEDNDSCLPPPWRVGRTMRGGPVRSPSISFEMDSLYVQPSNHSMRLSEAESRHSEPYQMHHHVIVDLPVVRPCPADLDLHSLPGQGRELDLDEEQIDPLSRVESWLLANDDQFLEPPSDDLPEKDLVVNIDDHDLTDTYL